MKSILFVDMHREGRSPSQRFRYEQYLPTLRANGYQVVHSFLLQEKDDRIFYSRGHVLAKSWIVAKSAFRRLQDVLKAGQFDYIFIQREAFMLGTVVFEKLFKRSDAKIIFDFDDAIWLPQVSRSGVNNQFLFLKNPRKTEQLIALADQVVAGNQYLANYAKKLNPNVCVIPTTIDTNLYQPKPKQTHSQVNIGWSGSTTTIDHLVTVLPALEKIKLKYGERVKFTVVGDGRFRYSALDIQGKNWNLETEVNELQQFDVGIMPLPDDDWAKGKCGLKGLQYMALAIPTVMSPVGVNSEIIQHGTNGLLAMSESDWVDSISLLVEHEEVRHQFGKAARETVMKHYSVDSSKVDFLSLFR